MRKVYSSFERSALAGYGWFALVFVTASIYLLGLGSPFAPTNGDEMVYIHIARMTAESGHWLPLQSELIDTRNTKPPLLIWQAMVAGNWGDSWNLFSLRLPSVLYTFATTAILAFFTFRISGRMRTACLAAALYLLYFSTFRYGRAYLTSAPETFWLALPMWFVLWLRLQPSDDATNTSTQATHLGWLHYSLFGVAMGLGAAYKSFALIAPAAAALWCARLAGSTLPDWRTILKTTLGVSWSALLGLGIFALWFAIDPDPAAVWQEFVVAENAGKMSNAQGYWHAAFFGAYPMWTQLLAYPANAGMLALLGLGFCWFSVSRGVRKQTYLQFSAAQWVLLSWLVVWLVVFTIPSQRSERYVIPAMPALAIVMALAWERISKWWALATLLILAPALVLLARIAWVIEGMDVGSTTLLVATLVAVVAGLGSIACGLVFTHWARNAALVGCLAVYASFSLMVMPLSATDAGYSPAVQHNMQGQRLAAPNGFTGQYERYHFLLRGARITPYDAEGRNTGALYPDMPRAERLQKLLTEFDAVIWYQDELTETQPSCAPACKVVASRWHVKSRHKSGEITLDNLWYPQQWLFRREWLITPGA
jgi:4-amino-4-deoxy-L-arabinose transferase-like glycosyltransferase